MACAIGVGVLTGAGGVAQTAAGDPYDPYPPDPYCDPYNSPPEADFDYSPVPPKPGEDVTFVSTATDPDGDELETGWDFDGDWEPTGGGDPFAGIDQTGDEAHFTYDSPGDYRVRMGVRDPCDAFDVIDKIVRVEAASGGTPGGGTPGGGTPGGGAATQDTTGPTIVIPGVNRTRRVSRNGVFTFFLGPFAENVTGTIGFESLRAVTSQRRRRKVRIGTKAVSVTQGRRLGVRAKLPRKGLRVLRRRNRLRMRARIVLRDSLGNASNRNYVFTLRPPRRASR